jgi:hypothetical protein
MAITSKRKARVLLAAGIGLTAIVFDSCTPPVVSGNLLAPQCPDGGFTMPCEQVDAGKPDGGVIGGDR